MFNFKFFNNQESQNQKGLRAKGLPMLEKTKEISTNRVGNPIGKNVADNNKPVMVKKEEAQSKYETPEKKVFFMGAETENNSEISKEDIETFINEGKASEKVVNTVANKITAGRQMTPEEIAIYSEYSKEIERILQDKQKN